MGQLSEKTLAVQAQDASGAGPQEAKLRSMRNKKRPLSLRMVKNLHQGLRIPCESLLADVR
jgi:HTH-type transcriptional regulator / antitoxin HigA